MSKKWRIEDGVMYFSIMSDGEPGKLWKPRLENHGIHVEAYAEFILKADSFISTDGEEMEIAVLIGSIFPYGMLADCNIRNEAKKRGLLEPSMEAAPLILEFFVKEKIQGIGISNVLVMHKDFDLDMGGLGGSTVLCADFLIPRLVGCHTDRGHFTSNYGFAFKVPKKKMSI